MKTLFIGGVKSGKSQAAERYILEWAKDVKPYYLATSECLDEEMLARIAVHKARRQDLFDTVEAPLQLLSTLQACNKPVLVECITLWLNNALHYQIPDSDILQELEAVMKLDIDLVLVQNETGFGIIPDNPLARHFVDLSGKAAQLIASYCDQVYFCCAGLSMPMK